MPKKEYSKLALRHQKYEPGFMYGMPLKNPIRIAAPSPGGHARLIQRVPLRFTYSVLQAPEVAL
jgi:hypothetical protein